MRDILLFKLLAQGDVEDPRVPALLRELAQLSLRERVPFFAYLAGLVEDASRPREVRAAALGAIAGATGVAAVELAVGALEEDALREAALDALREVAARAPERWIFAAFHPSADVRQAAYARRVPEGAHLFDLPLLADEVSRAGAIERLLTQRDGVAVHQASMLVDLARHEHVHPKLALTLLRKKHFAGLHARWVDARREAVFAPVLDGIEARGVVDVDALRGTDDALDVLVTALAEEPPELVAELVGVVGARLTVSAALARHRGAPGMAIAIAFGLPSALGTGLFHADEEEQIATALVERRVRGGRLPGVGIATLLRSSFVRGPDGVASPRRVAATLALALATPFTTLLETFSSDEVVALFTPSAREGALVLAVPFGELAEREPVWRILAGLPDGVRGAIEAAFVELASVDVLASWGACRSIEALRGLVQIARLDPARALAIAGSFPEALGRDLLDLVVSCVAPGAAPTCEVLVTALFQRAIDCLSIDAAAGALAAVPGPSLVALLARFANDETHLPFGLERALADLLGDHSLPALAAWAHALQPTALAPASTRRRAGVAFDPPRGTPDVERCVELLGSFDPVAATDRAFAASSRDDDDFLAALEVALAGAHASRRDALSPLGHAMLWRFEFHAFAHLDALLAEHGSLLAGLDARAGCVSRLLARGATLALASALAKIGARDRARFDALVDQAVIARFVDLLTTDLAEGAAEFLRAVSAGRLGDLSPHLPALRLALTELSAGVRARLAGVVDDAGLEHRALARRARVVTPATEEILARVRESDDLSWLVTCLSDEREVVVHEATLRLVLLGEAGCDRMVDALELRQITRESAVVVAACVSLWPDGPARLRARSLVEAPEETLAVRFRLAMAFVELGEVGALDLAVAHLLAETDERFFEPSDFDALVRGEAARCGVADADVRLARRLARSPHPRAHVPAIELLLARDAAAPPDLEAMRAFLEVGSARMVSLRRRVASRLLDAGDDTGLSVLLAHELEDTRGTRRVLVGLTEPMVVAAARSALIAGNDVLKESALLHHLRALDPAIAVAVFPVVLRDAQTDKLRIVAAAELSRPSVRARKIAEIVDVFLWGQRMARSLLGRRMRVKMTGMQKLGYTRMRESVVYVTPLPMLRGDRHGREVVEALVLHELGHHLYHAGKAGEAIWKKAEDEGIHGLFNLVADEHLERNLRAIDPGYGDRLKRLAAYAFQHTSKDVSVATLLRMLGSSAFAVVSRSRLGVARDPESVRVESGALLFGMERQGVAFARFARALRMGLGNRHDDPKVAEALGLFGPRFKQSTMEELLTIARRLKEIFGWETKLAESFGPHESLEGGDGELDPDAIEWGEGITQDEVDRAVQRFSERESGSTGAGAGGRLALNVNEETKFDPIRQIIAKPHDPVAHAPYRRRVEQPASVLRRYFDELGVGWVTERMRVAGRRIDRARLLDLVVRGDPRVLVARRPVQERDLFLGIVIDCSGSMQSNGNIEKAKLFATLVTEAAAPLRDVDVRVFGFTDQKLFDCGDARRSGVAGLRSEGGNNDAAALHHVAGLAKASARRAKVLTMISDGLPTECSVAALKNVVRQLTVRERMVVAQVAVQPLAEVCFPHYVVLQDADVTVTVRKFGTVIADLVRRALAG